MSWHICTTFQPWVPAFQTQVQCWAAQFTTDCDEVENPRLVSVDLDELLVELLDDQLASTVEDDELLELDAEDGVEREVEDVLELLAEAVEELLPDERLSPPTTVTLLELESDLLLELDGLVKLDVDVLSWANTVEVESEDHEENVLLLLVEELVECRIPELVEVLVDADVSVELDRLDEELVEALTVELEDELLSPGFALELEVEDQEARAVELDDVLVDADDHEEVEALVALDRLDVLEVELLLADELVALDCSRSPRTPITARSTATLPLTPAYSIRKRFAPAVQAKPSKGASRMMDPPGPIRLYPAPVAHGWLKGSAAPSGPTLIASPAVSLLFLT